MGSSRYHQRDDCRVLQHDALGDHDIANQHLSAYGNYDGSSEFDANQSSAEVRWRS